MFGEPELEHNPHSPSPCSAQGKKVEKLGVKGLEGVLRFVIVSYYPTLI